MKLLTRETDYAVRILACLAGKGSGQSCPVSLLQRESGIPRPFLRRITLALCRAGILISSRGKNGGVKLAVPASEINLSGLIGVFQGEISLGNCLFRKKICPGRKTCVLRKKLHSIEATLRRELSGITLASLLKKDQ